MSLAARFRCALIPLASLLAFSSAVAAAPTEPLDAGVTLFENVHVVSMASPGVQANRSVLVRGGRIESVGVAGELDAGPEARVIDGGGTAYLIPGLADMHVHFPPDAGDPGSAGWRTATLLLANGVTTARGLAGHPAHLELRRRIFDGELLGPTPHVAGPAVHAGAVKSADAAAAMVRQQKEAGYDVVKAHALPDADVWEAVQRTAAEVGLPVAGHVANDVGLDRATAAGQQVEHLDAFIAALQGKAAEGVAFGQFPPPALVVGIADGRVRELAERIAKAGAWNTPTLALFARIVDLTTPTAALRDRAEMRYIHDSAVDAWTMQREGLLSSGHFDAQYAQNFPEVRNRIVRALRDAGAPLMAGSDSPQAFFAPGFALHDELGALVAAGLTPWEALQTATANPARYFASLPNGGSTAGARPDFGTIEPGRRADLVLLDADPTADIANARAIRGVMLRGRWLDRAALDGLFEECARSVGKAG